MVNFVAAGAGNEVFTPLFGGQPVRIWTPGAPLLSPQRGGGGGGGGAGRDGGAGNGFGGGRGGAESNARAAPPPPPPMTLPGCVPLDAERNPAEGWTADLINSGLSSPMARNVNAIMAAVNGTKTKRRVTFLNEPTSGKTARNASAAQKGIQERKIERRPARNPYRKSETQTRRKAFPARATKLASAAGNQQRQWNFPTRIEEFQKPEVEDIFNDFWKTVEDHQMESFFRDFWLSVKDQDDKMELYFGQFWKAIVKNQDCVFDINDFWRRIEGRSRKAHPKENLAADFWRMIEKTQQRQMLDEAVMAGHFLRMIESTQRCQQEARPWEAPSRDMWKLINQEQKHLVEERVTPEALAGEFFRLTAKEKRQVSDVNDMELVSGQFWRMLERNNKRKDEIKFVADSYGNVFRKFKGYRVNGNRRESMADAKFVNDFFEMVESEQHDSEASIENFAGEFWKMVRQSQSPSNDAVFVADSAGNIFKNHKGYQIKASQKDKTTEAKWVSEFFKMLEKEQENNDARVESLAGNFWQMINNSKVETERKPREAAAGDFWKMVDFTESLKRKRETMRRLSASKREEEQAAATAPSFHSASPKKTNADKNEGARKTALLFACSTLEEQAYYVLATDYQDPQGHVGRKRTTSSSSSSLYSVKEEEELTPESAASVESDAANPRRVYRVAPHYNNNNQSQQLGAAKVASVKTGSGVILVALRQKKKSIKPQQCHRQNMVAQERRGSVTRRNRIPSVSAIGSNNDRKCGRKTW